MKKLLIFLSAMTLALLFLAAVGPAQEAGPAKAGAGVQLGTFDSRVIAIAYYRSDQFKEHVADIRTQHDAAKKAGDQKTMDRLEKMMSEQQTVTHQQGFGTAPIPEILKLVEKEIPELALQAGVDVVVCKWDLLYQNPSSTSTDLSLTLAEQFNPDAATRKILAQMLTTDPVPMAELEGHVD